MIKTSQSTTKGFVFLNYRDLSQPDEAIFPDFDPVCVNNQTLS